MNRLEYMTKLRRILEDSGMQENEINDAMQFYEEIFLDAGAEHDSETAQNLGTPEELAKKIIADSDSPKKPEFIMDSVINNDNQTQSIAPQQNYDTSSVLVKLLIAVITFPIWFSVLVTVLSLVFAFFVTVFSIAIAFVGAGVGCTIGGIIALFSAPPIGLIVLGSGLILIGLAGFVFIPMMKFIWHTAVRFVNWLVSFVRKIFRVGGVQANG